MSDRDPYVQTQALIALALVLFAGTAVALWTPFGFSLLLGSVALLRICWIEDNIHQDLLEADRVPAGYRATQRRRATVLGAEEEFHDPLRLASFLRVQARAWATFLWALTATHLLASGGAGAMLLGAAAFSMALRGADRAAAGLAMLALSPALPRHMLTEQSALARAAYSSRVDD